jgi:site-specific DNA-methyltransferase (adenine-specific)
VNRWTLHHGDALATLRTMPTASVDAIVTDPPAGIAFMNAEWDKDKGGRDAWIAWLAEVFTEARRVAKPGTHALVWALPRTSHWTATGLENAGWELRDRVAHFFGTGFPKSHNLDGEWDGWGTALKPAVEDWHLARAPFAGTVAANVAVHGTGALHIDACRIAASARPLIVSGTGTASPSDGWGGIGLGSRAAGSTDVGRWPAHLVLDEEAAALLDEQSGDCPGMSGGGEGDRELSMFGIGGVTKPETVRGDSGGASRFFFCAKPSTAEREMGLDGFVSTTVDDGRAITNDTAYQRGATQRRNIHPTVKSVALMRWLMRLITPPNGLVLDLFTGSGTTGIAAMCEGFCFVGCEAEAPFAAIARARIAFAAANPRAFDPETAKPAKADPRQADLFGRTG